MNQNKEFLGTEPIGPLLRRLALPTVTAQIINMLYNMVDRIYIGQQRRRPPFLHLSGAEGSGVGGADAGQLLFAAGDALPCADGGAFDLEPGSFDGLRRQPGHH